MIAGFGKGVKQDGEEDEEGQDRPRGSQLPRDPFVEYRRPRISGEDRTPWLRPSGGSVRLDGTVAVVEELLKAGVYDLLKEFDSAGQFLPR